MKHRRRAVIIRTAIWAILTLACCDWMTAQAAEPQNLELETRQFKVSVDGKERGKCTMQIRRRNDGTDKMTIDAGLSFNFVVYEYRYHSAGSEIWKDGRLLQLDNTADFNGTKYVVKAGSDPNGLVATVNGKKSQLAADAWVTSYWRLPDHLAEKTAETKDGVVPAGGTRSPAQRNAKTVLKKGPHSVALLDSDKGQHLHGKITHVGDEMLTVAGKRQTCAHYRIAGDVQVELWYDATRRLVRQESVDDGHKTLMEITRIAAE